MPKIIEISENFPDGTKQIIASGPETDYKLNKMVSEISVYSAKYKNNQFLCKLVDEPRLD